MLRALGNFLFKTRNHLIYAKTGWSPFTGVEDRGNANVQFAFLILV